MFIAVATSTIGSLLGGKRITGRGSKERLKFAS